MLKNREFVGEQLIKVNGLFGEQFEIVYRYNVAWRLAWLLENDTLQGKIQVVSFIRSLVEGPSFCVKQLRETNIVKILVKIYRESSNYELLENVIIVIWRTCEGNGCWVEELLSNGFPQLAMRRICCEARLPVGFICHTLWFLSQVTRYCRGKTDFRREVVNVLKKVIGIKIEPIYMESLRVIRNLVYGGKGVKEILETFHGSIVLGLSHHLSTIREQAVCVVGKVVVRDREDLIFLIQQGLLESLGICLEISN